jgi:hypothetical protein
MEKTIIDDELKELLVKLNSPPTFGHYKYFPMDLTDEETDILLEMNDLPKGTYIASMKNCYDVTTDENGEQKLTFIKKVDPHEIMEQIQKIIRKRDLT